MCKPALLNTPLLLHCKRGRYSRAFGKGMR